GGFAGPGGFGGFGGGNATVSSAFAKLLESGAARYTWAAAPSGADSAASMELATAGIPVMAIGGFRGTDPAPSLAQFEKLVSRAQDSLLRSGRGARRPRVRRRGRWLRRRGRWSRRRSGQPRGWRRGRWPDR